MTRLAPSALLLLAACTSAPPPAPVFTSGVRPPEVVVPSAPSLASRLAAADARLAKFRERRVWPSPSDRETWQATLADAERFRRACAGDFEGDAGTFAEVLGMLEGRLDMLAASDSTYRLGERMREQR